MDPDDPAPAIDPISLLLDWLPGVPGVDGYFPAASVATVDGAGWPEVRTLLVSEIVDGELYFHIDSRSRTRMQLAAMPRAAVAITLPDSMRQVVVQGEVLEADDAERLRAYRRRSRYLQLLAWLNTPAMAAGTPEERERVWQEFDRHHPPGTLEPPASWFGFAVRPHRITFWQGRSDAPSHRTEYRATADSWDVVHLPG